MHPDTLQQIADLCRPPRKVFVFVNWNAGKLYHGDLLERSYCYMLALTGNLGKAGTGSRGWSPRGRSSAALCRSSAVCRRTSIEAENPIASTMNMFQMMMEDYKNRVKMDPTMPPVEAALGSLRELLRAAGTLSPPWALWYHHAGYKEVWDKHLEDPNCKKKISEYAEEAHREGVVEGVRAAREGLPAEGDVRVGLESAAAPSRRHEHLLQDAVAEARPDGDAGSALEHDRALLRLRVAGGLSLRVRGRQVLDAAHAVHGPSPTSPCPCSASRRATARSSSGSCAAASRASRSAGIEKYKSGDREIVVDELYWRATYGHHYGDSNEDEERLRRRHLPRHGEVGWYDEPRRCEVSLENVRRTGRRGSAGARRGTPRWPKMPT